MKISSWILLEGIIMVIGSVIVNLTQSPADQDVYNFGVCCAIVALILPMHVAITKGQ